jgi:hypothetical protein
MSPAPATQHLPMPRATTAAWLVMPPRLVRMPSAAFMPRMSSGLVSMRTRITFLPCSAQASASAALNTTWPTAAPGRGGQALGDLGLLGLGVQGGVQELVKLLRAAPASRRSFLSISFSLHHVHRDLHGGGGGALAHAGLQHPQLALLDGELDVLHILVVLLPACCGCRTSCL